MRQLTHMKLEGDGLSILNDDSRLVPEMDGILALVKRYNMVLATGHMSPAEIFALVERAHAMGIGKLVITHPVLEDVMEKILSLEDQQRLVQMGAVIEHTYVDFLPNQGRKDPLHMAEAIRSVGVEHCIITTDLGQHPNPPPAEGMRMFIALLLRMDFNEKEIEIMARVNPARLLDLE